MIAGFTKTPELELSEQEGNALAVALKRVADHYPGLGGAVSGETMAWIALVQVCAMVYGPRVMAMRMRRRQETAQTVEQPPNPAFYQQEGMMP